MINCAPLKHPATINVVIIPADNVARDWRIYQPFVVQAIEHETRPVEALEVLTNLREGLWIALGIWVGEDLHGFCIVNQQKALRGFELNVTMLAGQWMELWMDHLFDALVKVAKSQSCDALRLEGRLGWVKKLKRYGFKPISQTLKLEFGDG